MKLNQQKISCLSGVGSKTAELLKKEIKINSWQDMLYYFPYRYIDRSKIFTIKEIQKESPFIQLKGKILSYEYLGTGKSLRLTATFSDQTGSIKLVWFKRTKGIMYKYKIGIEYILFGKPTIFNNQISIVHPELDLVNNNLYHIVGIEGHYHTTEQLKKARLSSKFFKKLILQILNNIKTPLPETLTKSIIQKEKLMSLNHAIQNIHFPTSFNSLKEAQYRLKFEEFFYLQLYGIYVLKYRKRKVSGFLFKKIGNYFNDFYHKNLSFTLTNAQKRVVKEIRQDVKSGSQMNRLVQGDVGSGKTLVALLSILFALDNGFQAVLMAPTEILAIQHYKTILDLLKGLDIKIALLTGSTNLKKRKYLLPAIKDKKIQLLIGTHILTEKTIKFGNLGLVVIDEQHRFGVEQRAKLWRKNNITSPHILIMTATPIPRTLAMTVYSNLDISVIDELPPGRKNIQTIHIFSEKRNKLYEFVRKQLQFGQQVYIVYPLIEESENIDLKNLTEGFALLKKIFPEYEICMIHGKMKFREKETEMQKFILGISKIMIATTVIEVGVNIPNATVMIIENAERFGLTQLHQLRGRVGRGSKKSFCILITEHKLSENAQKRILTMIHTNDGFIIAEEDLKLRGPGDINGTQQSGMDLNLKIAHFKHDNQILITTRNIVNKLLSDDPFLKKTYNILLRKQLYYKSIKHKTNWLMIS